MAYIWNSCLFHLSLILTWQIYWIVDLIHEQPNGMAIFILFRNTNLVPRTFSPSSYSKKMHWGRGCKNNFICGCVFPVSILNKVVLQQQITIIFDKKKQPTKIFLPKNCSSAVVQILKKYLWRSSDFKKIDSNSN